MPCVSIPSPGAMMTPTCTFTPPRLGPRPWLTTAGPWSWWEIDGSERRRGELELNLGAMLVKQDRLAETETLLTSALARARADGQHEFEAIALCNWPTPI